MDTSTKYFDQQAPTWEKYYAPGGGMTSRIARFRSAIREHGPRSGRILDFGCGSGDLSNSIAEAGYSVVGVDQAAAMIARASQRFGSKQVSFAWLGESSPSTSLPFANEEFDGIVCSSVLEYVDDVPACLREFRRVVRPEGRLFATVPNMMHPIRTLEKAERIARGIVNGRRWMGDERLRYLTLSRNRPSAKGWREMCEGSDWRVDEIVAEGSTLSMIIAQRPRPT